jgi:small subunit ribosomal protein S6
MGRSANPRLPLTGLSVISAPSSGPRSPGIPPQANHRPLRNPSGASAAGRIGKGNIVSDTRFYEHVFIARPDLSQQQVEAIIEQVAATVDWGLKSLTYRINKNRRGHYALVNIEAPPAVELELRRRQSINEDIIRIRTFRVEALDEEPSAMMTRKDRDERRRARREGRDDGGGYEGGDDFAPAVED